MSKSLKILRRASQKNCLDTVHTVITQLGEDYTRTSFKGPNARKLHWTFKGLSGDQY